MNKSTYDSLKGLRDWQLFLIVFMITGALALAPVIMGGKHMALASYVRPAVTLDSTGNDIIASFGDGDQASYAKGAKMILEGGDPRGYYFGLWAPGFTVIEAMVMKWWHGPLVKGLAYFTFLLWSFTLATSALVLRRLSRSGAVPFLVLAFFLFDLMRKYFLFHGIILSESISIALFLPGCLLLCLAFMQRRLWLAAAAALLLVGATLVRAQFLLAMQASFTLLLLFFMITRSIPNLRRRLPNSLPARELFMAVMLYAVPIAGYSAWNGGGFVHMDSYIYDYAWRPAPVTADFVEAGGGGVLCQVDPKTCHRMQARPPGAAVQGENRRTVIHSILTHPLSLFIHKSGYFLRFFFMSVLGGKDYLENGILAFMALFAVAGCGWFARRPFFQALLLMQIGTWAGSLAPSFTLVHFEARYLYIGKSLAFFSALAVVAALIHDRRYRQLSHSPAVPDQSPRA